MKRYTILLLVFSNLLGMFSCSNKETYKKDDFSLRKEISLDIDENLIKQLTGTWIGNNNQNYPDKTESLIFEKDGFIYFDNEKLEIIDVTNNTIHTQTNKTNTFYYDFKVRENKLTVYPMYPVSEGSKGGELAPIEYIKKDNENTDISKLYGDWQSVDEESNYYISIKRVSDNLMSYADNLENRESKILYIEEIKNESIIALTEDKRNRYIFTLSGDDIMTANMGINSDYYSKKVEEQPVGLAKPIIYKKIIK